MNIFKLFKNSVKKEGGFGFLNIVGLSIGMAMSLLIIWYLQYHLSYNSQIPDKENIYRVVSIDRNSGIQSFGNPLPFAYYMTEDYPGVGEVAAMSPINTFPVTIGELSFDIRTSTANSDIFKMLGSHFLIGSESSLSEPGNTVITRSCAQKLFGNTNPVGKSIKISSFGDEIIFTVSGIIEDAPTNNDFNPEMYLSWQSMNPSNWKTLWWWGGTQIIVKVINDQQKKELEQKMNTILERHRADYINGRYDYQLIPLSESHFRTDIEQPLRAPVSSILLWILSIVAGFIIVVACINFVNLSVGQSERNAKETGINKILGASKKKLAFNYMAITFLKVSVALILTVLITIYLSAPFEQLTGINNYDLFSGRYIWFVLFGMALVSSAISGLYPAYLIAKSNPVTLLSPGKGQKHSGNSIRRILIASQFTIAIVLMISSLFIFKQISFLKNHEIGFNEKGLVAVDLSPLEDDTDYLEPKLKLLEQEVLKRGEQNGITKVAAMEAIPGSHYRNGFAIFNLDNDNTYTAISVGIDENYAGLLEQPILEGRNFSAERASDAGTVLINETLKNMLGWKSVEDKQLGLYSKNNKVSVIGVFKDVNIGSLNRAIPPMIYQYKENSYPLYIVFRVAPGRENNAVETIKGEWDKLFEGARFEWFSVADRFKMMYGNEERLSKIIGAFCLIAVLLSCFGLLASISFSVIRRTKEIGIRKVNGAGTGEVVSILTRDLIKWIVVAFVIATPIAYYAMNRWLQNFAYKTNLSWWIFALAGLLALGIALLTVSWQSWRAATRNPVEALRYE